MLRDNFFYKNIPNLFTLMNLLCGAIAIVLSFEGRNNLVLASYFIYTAAVFDFFDGFAARALRASSPIGKELDSLSDIVSFGIAPSMIIYQLLKYNLQIKQFSFALPISDILILMSAMLIALFSAIRLAKFNIDDRQTESFLGLATPACAMLVASIPLIAEFNPDNLILFPAISDNIYFFLGILFFGGFIVRPMFLVPLVIFLSVLLVVEMPLFSMKFKSLNYEDNKMKFFFLIFSFLFFITIQILAVPVIFVLYIFFSLFDNLLKKKLNKRTEENLNRLFME
ncbi:MAG: CDP-diacylglycerol--serine O-phosphatidyltransferase [Bacteroidales bacterium]